jgi:choice-of-anchor A domain-containing protein
MPRDLSPTSAASLHAPIRMFMRNAAALVVASVVIVAANASSARATPLTAADIMGQFNAVISNSFTSNSDVEGRLVTNVLAGGATFYLPRGTAAASQFKAVNAITIGSGVRSANVNNSGGVNWVSSDAGTFSLNGGSIAQNSPTFTMASFTAPIDDLIVQLAAIHANSTVNATDPNNFTFVEKPDYTGTSVFSLTTTQLSAARNIIFSGSATTIIVNVSGSSFNPMANFNASTTLNQSIIWNFADATSISLQGWHGAVLAKNATVSNSSAMEGFLYAANFNGRGELHDFSFTGVLPSSLTVGSTAGMTSNVPEPGSLLLLGSGLIGILLNRRQARSALATQQ